MASSFLFRFLPLLALSFTLLLGCSSADGSDSNTNTMLFTCHKGPLLRGPFSVNLIWYGNFKPAQRAIVTDFISSLSQSGRSSTKPSVTAWWSSVEKYYRVAYPKSTRPNSLSLSLSLSLGKQLLDNKYSLGKSLTSKQLRALASKAAPAAPNSVNVVLTAADVAVEGFCMSKCGSHGSIPVTKPNSPQQGKENGKSKNRTYRYPCIWVGNSETQCPGQCAWPFHQPIYGPQGPPLVSPNNDVGLDGIIINLATLLAGTATNPFGNGCFQGPKEAPLEAASACPGVYGKGAYPGYAGNLLVDRTSGASYNAYGVNGRKYLLPALYDLSTQACSTLV